MDLGDIPSAVRKSLELYDKLRGKDVNEADVAFWELVVLTARDEVQSAAYRQQIDDKLRWGQLPCGVQYLVFSDPPGPKVGCGGTTFGVLNSLHQQFGDDLFEKRVLLINAGGYSQRLPSTSVLGKVFMALPIDKPHMYQLLDFKLACYLPFLPNMRPGVFHASSDTIEVFDLGPSLSAYNFDREGLTAVAHPNTISVGRNHGVFVFDKPAQGESDVDVPFTETHACLQVLQKPSEASMRESGAVRRNIKTGEEIVYTDSCYFYDHSITKKFIQFYNQEAPLDCEIDSYGDFFQPLGRDATEAYIHNTSKVVNVTDSLIPTRRKIFTMLRGSPLNVVILNASKFYHLGTTSEYLYHFTENAEIAKEAGFAREEFCSFPCADSDGTPRRPRLDSAHRGTFLHSIVPYAARVAASAVLEYCHFAVPLRVGERCIVSSCTVSSSDGLYGESMEAETDATEPTEARATEVTDAPTSASNANANATTDASDATTTTVASTDATADTTEIPEFPALEIPAETFLHTVPVTGPPGYCTVLFHIADNVKQRSDSPEKIHELQYLAKPLIAFQKALGLNSVSSSNSENITLWDSKLFPLCDTMSESFLLALRIRKAVEKEEEGSLADIKTRPLFSMADIMEKKDLQHMLQYRHDLYTCIVAMKDHQDPQ